MTAGRDAPLRIAALRAEIAELGAVIGQLRRAGLDSATAKLLLARKRAQLDGLMKPSASEAAAPLSPAQPRG